MAKSKQNGLHHHITAVKKGERAFENAFQAVSRMILEKKIDKVIVNGKSTPKMIMIATMIPRTIFDWYHGFLLPKEVDRLAR